MPSSGQHSSAGPWSLRRVISLLVGIAWLAGAGCAFLLAGGAPALAAEGAPSRALAAACAAITLAALLGATALYGGRLARTASRSAQRLAQRRAGAAQPFVPGEFPTELRALADSVNSALARVEQASAAESRFCSSAAHELRTPLAGIKIQVQAAKYARSDVDRQVALDRAIHAVDQATHMVDQLLTLSRIDGLAALKTSAARLELATVAAQVLEDLRPIADRRGQHIEDQLAPAQIEGLEFGIGMLMRNLIDNALRYGPSPGTVRVTTRSEVGGGSLLVVEDAGPGIAPEDHERVFRRFERIATDDRGCGIGLSIVQSVVELHRARVELGRSDLGGLRVAVWFPAVRDSRAAAADEPATGTTPAAA